MLLAVVQKHMQFTAAHNSHRHTEIILKRAVCMVYNVGENIMQLMCEVAEKSMVTLCQNPVVAPFFLSMQGVFFIYKTCR